MKPVFALECFLIGGAGGIVTTCLMEWRARRRLRSTSAVPK